MSRNNIQKGQITLHPGGIPHGPHPGAIERSVGKNSTDELAVMIDPFNPVMTVSFAIPKMGLASVKVFDISGRELAVLSNQNYQPGYYSVNWNASDYSSGVYFISLKTNGTTITQKVLLLK